MEDLWRDLQYASRTLRKNPGFTAIAILTLALGIGANSAGFAVFDAIVLKPLPVNNPESLVLVTRVGGRSAGGWLSYAAFKDLHD